MMNDKRLRIDLDDHLALMVTEIERPNRGRPHDPFSPVAQLASAYSASGAPGGSAVAAPPSCGVGGHHGAVHATVLT